MNGRDTHHTPQNTELSAGGITAGVTRHHGAVSRSVAAALGMSVPIAVGVWAGKPGLGLAASLAGLALSGPNGDRPWRHQLYTLVAGSVAMLAGSFMAVNQAAAFGIPALAAFTALVGGISRPMARAGAQLILFTIIAANIDAGGTDPLVRTLLFFLGAVWMLGLDWAIRLDSTDLSASRIEPAPRYPAKRLWQRWRASLAHLSGWQYTIRVTLCLAAANVYAWLWPNHHGYWAAVTVVIVVQRQLQFALKRTLQRALGTAIGVLLAALVLVGTPSAWVAIALIATFAAARPVLAEFHYVAYTTVMTPLVILLLDYGRPASWTVVSDRLLATLVGCVLSLTLGYVGWLKLTPSAPAGSPRRPD